MVGTILILHAQDADEEAEELCFELGRIGFHAVSFFKVTRRSTKSEILKAISALLDSVSVVIVLASPEIFIDLLLIEIALKASVEKKFLPVIFGYEEVDTSDWFSSPIRLISGIKDDPLQWNKLIDVLRRRTGQFLSFTSSDLGFRTH